MRGIISLLWPQAIHEQWYEFTDARGHGYCQTDHIVEFDHCIVVFESKLTQTFDAIKQINGLYRPVVELALKKPVIGVQVCKNLVKEGGKDLIHNPRAIPTFKPSLRVWTWHHLGEPL